MTVGKVKFSIGALSFSGEGEQVWLAKQLDKIVNAAKELEVSGTSSDPPDTGSSTGAGTSTKPKPFKTTLASHIKAMGGESSQVARFLTTADWLRQRGQTPLTTSVVTKALSSNHQKKLANPADCLNKNCTKGHCEKTNDGFFITPDGLQSLGSK